VPTLGIGHQRRHVKDDQGIDGIALRERVDGRGELRR
jgi:hypothetical protein